MAECKPAAAPMEVNLKLEKLDAAEINTTEYQQLIGSLMYGFIGTRFDIAHDMGKLSRHNHTPGNRHHTTVKRVEYSAIAVTKPPTPIVLLTRTDSWSGL